MTILLLKIVAHHARCGKQPVCHKVAGLGIGTEDRGRIAVHSSQFTVWGSRFGGWAPGVGGGEAGLGGDLRIHGRLVAVDGG